MKHSRRYFNLLLVLLFGLTGMTYAGTLEKTVKKEASLKYGGEVVLDNVNGKITIEGWDREEVSVIAEIRVRDRNEDRAQELLDEIEIDFDERRGEIRIRTITPKRNSGFWGWASGNKSSVSVYYRVKVPEECSLDIDNTNGAIEVSDVEGEIRLESTNGKIWTESVGGTVDANTTNGSIKVDIADITSSKDMEFTTTNGSVKIYLPEDAGFDLNARTTNGSIKTDFSMNTRSKYNRRRMQGSVNGGGPLVYVETTNGSINVWER